ncbi:hypothetical protein EHS25_007764 [Saitozyma podzolica]|uniref:Uncharacterized protein n=1 Tax=Saitozyma podzolica TaxID=1890683 RepID=A0A427YQM4_9TREE|nr:hypothetical protein EHS25_007764 [Saitozyma podzolica]
MIYAIGLVIFLVAILLIYFVRLMSNRYRTTRARHTAHGDPEAFQRQTEQIGPTPTLRGVASDMSSRVFHSPADVEGEEYVPFHRRSMSTVGGEAVQREHLESDPELPSYIESATMPRPPLPVYSGTSRAPAPNPDSRTNLPAYGDAPPKYVPDQQPPIVRTL